MHHNVKNLEVASRNPVQRAILGRFLVELFRFDIELYVLIGYEREISRCTNLKIQANSLHSAMKFLILLRKSHHGILTNCKGFWTHKVIIGVPLSDPEVRFEKRPKFIHKLAEFP